MFDALCLRLWSRVQETVDEMLRYFAGLFSISFESIKTGSLWRTPEGFYYKFWQEPLSMTLLGNALVLSLPKFIGDRMLLGKLKRTAVEFVDTQAGRVRHSFEERIKKGVEDFRRELADRIEATIAAIETAIRSGAALRAQGESEVAKRQAVLSHAAAHIASLESRVKKVACRNSDNSASAALR